MKRFFKILMSKMLLKNIIYAAGLCVLVLWLTMLFLKIYTRHGQARIVPDFKGLTINEVEEVCEKHKFRYQIADSVYITRMPKGSVLEQNPMAGSRVKKGRNIFLTMNAVSPELVVVPKVIGVTFRQAKAILEAKNLSIGKLEYVPDIAINNVLNQRFKGASIAPGSEIPKYSKIDLVLGNGYGNKNTYIPYLAGKDIDNARELLIDAFCNIGTIIYDYTINNKEDSLKAFVWKHIPDFNDDHPVKLGTYVDLYITVDPKRIQRIENNPENNNFEEIDLNEFENIEEIEE